MQGGRRRGIKPPVAEPGFLPKGFKKLKNQIRKEANQNIKILEGNRSY